MKTSKEIRGHAILEAGVSKSFHNLVKQHTKDFGYLNLSDFIRFAIREKLARDEELKNLSIKGADSGRKG